MNKILNNDEMKLIAADAIADLSDDVSNSDDKQFIINETLIQCAAKVAYLNFISMQTKSDEGIIPVFNYHFRDTTKNMPVIIDQKLVN